MVDGGALGDLHVVDVMGLTSGPPRRGGAPARKPSSISSSSVSRQSPGGPKGAPTPPQQPKGTPKVIGVPLGSIIPRRLTDDATLVIRDAPRSPLAERYRSLVQRLVSDHIQGRQSQQVITVTSAAPNEGKTTTVLNLCLALAERKDHSTLLIDADLRRPSISKYLHPAPKVGLSDVLQGEARLEHALLELQDAKLTVLPAGALVLNPQELLRSQFVSALFADLRRQFDHVIVDTPPVVPFTDAAVLGALSDGVVLVVRANKTPRPLVERAVDAMQSAKVLGVVLNAVEITPIDRYYYKYDEYNPDRYAIREEDE